MTKAIRLGSFMRRPSNDSATSSLYSLERFVVVLLLFSEIALEWSRTTQQDCFGVAGIRDCKHLPIFLNAECKLSASRRLFLGVLSLDLVDAEAILSVFFSILLMFFSKSFRFKYKCRSSDVLMMLYVCSRYSFISLHSSSSLSNLQRFV